MLSSIFQNYENNNNNFFSLCQEDIISLCEELTSTERKILDYLLILADHCYFLFPSQTTLGNKSGIGRQRTNTLIKKMCELGLIAKNYRHNKTSQYAVNPLFMSPSVRVRLSNIFKAFRWLPIILLYSIPYQAVGQAIQTDATQNLPVNKIYLTRFGNKLNNVSNLTDSRVDPYPIKRRSMFNVYGSDKRSALILELTGAMGLTKAGQCKLAPFPLEALEFAVDKLRLSTSIIHNVWPWFITLCKEYCSIHDIRPDWKTEDLLLGKYGLKRDSAPIKGDFDPSRLRKNKSHATGEYEKSFSRHNSAGKGQKEEGSRSYYKPWDKGRQDEEAAASKKTFKPDPAFDAIQPDYRKPHVYQAAYQAGKTMLKCLPEHEIEKLIADFKLNPQKYGPPQTKLIEELIESRLPEPEIVDTLDADQDHEEVLDEFIPF